MQRGKEVNENPQTNVPDAKEAVLRAECVSSLKADFMVRLAACGFRTQTEALLTLARDFVAGRILYRGGVLVCQQKNILSDFSEGQGSPTAAVEPSNANPAMVPDGS